MATGEAKCSTISAFILIPVWLMLVISQLKIKRNENKDMIILGECIVLGVFVVCTSQKLVTSYAWWGDTEASYWEKTETSSMEALKGFKFSPQEKQKYDQLTKIIDEYSDEDDIIWGFPYTKVYNVFLDNYNMVGNVPILFYDVCSENFAKNEAGALYVNRPQIVIWQDIPNCMEVHELIFRDGEPLGQRQIQKWFSEVKDTEYTLIGQVDNVFVYKLNDETEVVSTYIERKTKPNTTADYTSKGEVKDLLAGEGTAESPYLISDMEDLRIFRDLVNSGVDFENQFVLQTADIDLSDIETWAPIGLFGSENIFKGIYNGDGYWITNLKITEGGNAGLFGVLGGVVENVMLIDCDISGACIGGIASHGSNATIVNCFVSGKLCATTRAAGIADNMGGNIFNCVSVCELDAPIVAGISGYYTNTVENCFSNMGNDYSIDDGKAYDVTVVEKLNEYVTTCKEKTWNLNEWIWEDEVLKLEICNNRYSEIKKE